ncbi:Hypothetical protein SRAE_2000461100 [Strongyloides ratti]|uniref:Uncharacterized protein n=1 Tax=Strongyloides ratti TaxID=34506 RepID=A0A090N029_STRRB|nr:Hypothetical protein SRAE_2000461100 [Strongyloides ratti]CEF69965.1 Hypothetical protein SRAE_2000461100 [Strongyloides ratti]
MKKKYFKKLLKNHKIHLTKHPQVFNDDFYYVGDFSNQTYSYETYDENVVDYNGLYDEKNLLMAKKNKQNLNLVVMVLQTSI